MPTGPEWALQTGVYQRLSADADLVARLGGTAIYDDVPQDAPFPYVTLGEITSRERGSASGEGREHTLTLHVWSRTKGRKEVQEIAALVTAALHDANLALQDHTLVNLRFTLSDARRDPDGETYHGVVQFRAVSEPAA